MSLNFRDINDLLLIKPKGVFEIQTAPNGKPVIMVYRPGELDETIFCLSPATPIRSGRLLPTRG